MATDVEVGGTLSRKDTSRLTGRGQGHQTRHLTDQGFGKVRRVTGPAQGLVVHLGDGRDHRFLLLGTVADDHSLLEGGGAGNQGDSDRPRLGNSHRLGLVPDERDLECVSNPRLNGSLSVEVRHSARLGGNHHDAGLDDRCSGLVQDCDCHLVLLCLTDG